MTLNLCVILLDHPGAPSAEAISIYARLVSGPLHLVSLLPVGGLFHPASLLLVMKYPCGGLRMLLKVGGMWGLLSGHPSFLNIQKIKKKDKIEFVFGYYLSDCSRGGPVFGGVDRVCSKTRSGFGCRFPLLSLLGRRIDGF